MQAILLAGGLGTRLRPIVNNIPKPMAPIHGKPFLAYLLDYLDACGITDVILSVCYRYEQIQAYFKDQYLGIHIRYAIEDQLLGTGGAIVNALSLINSFQPIFILNGDTFLKLNYQKMLAEHFKTDSSITLSLRYLSNCYRYGTVLIDQNRVIEFRPRGEAHAGLINGGVYLIQPDLFERYTLPRIFSFENDFLLPHVNSLHATAFITDDYFIDMGIPEDYELLIKEPKMLSSSTKKEYYADLNLIKEFKNAE